MPISKQADTISLLASSSQKRIIDSATIGPISSMASSASKDASRNVSISPWKACSSIFAVCSPTCLMPRANTKRAKVVALASVIDAKTLLADFSPMRSSPDSVA